MTLRTRMAVSFAVAVAASLLLFCLTALAILYRAEGIHEESIQDAKQVLQAMAVATPVALAGAVGLGVWLARKSLLPLKDAGARVRAARASELDLTLPVGFYGEEWDDLARTLNGLLGEARQSLARIRSFTADAAHELRTPLTAMMGDIDVTMRRERSGEELRAALAGVRADAARLANIVEALLTLARADAGSLIQKTAPEALDTVAHEAVSQALQAVPAAEARVEVHTVAEVRCERTLLVRALKNLVENGLIHGGGRVEVLVSAEQGMGRVLVRDHGPGIERALAPYLFERFRQGDASRTGKGAGLGLSLARTLVEAQGGTVRALEPDRGAEFEVRIPLAV